MTPCILLTSHHCLCAFYPHIHQFQPLHTIQHGALAFTGHCVHSGPAGHCSGRQPGCLSSYTFLCFKCILFIQVLTYSPPGAGFLVPEADKRAKGVTSEEGARKLANEVQVMVSECMLNMERFPPNSGKMNQWGDYALQICNR